MEITTAQVKALRDATGAGMMDCRNALREAGGDLDKATKLLREAGKAGVEKRAGRSTTQGVVDAYLHTPDPNLPPKLGVLVELDCETDFVAKTDEFQRLAMAELEVPFLRRWLMWAAVRIISLLQTGFRARPQEFGYSFRNE